MTVSIFEFASAAACRCAPARRVENRGGITLQLFTRDRIAVEVAPLGSDIRKVRRRPRERVNRRRIAFDRMHRPGLRQGKSKGAQTRVQVDDGPTLAGCNDDLLHEKRLRRRAGLQETARREKNRHAREYHSRRTALDDGNIAVAAAPDDACEIMLLSDASQRFQCREAGRCGVLDQQIMTAVAPRDNRVASRSGREQCRRDTAQRFDEGKNGWLHDRTRTQIDQLMAKALAKPDQYRPPRITRPR